MPIKGQSKTTKTRTCWPFHKNSPYWEKELGPMLNQENSISDHAVSKKLIHHLRHGCRMMEQLNSGELKTIFRNMSRIVLIGLIASGRKPWQEEEETRKDTSIVLIRQE